ncbi:hypothetical protein [Marinibactrum halimedae]|uniref:hypothetical protein n=1 Tax=Marinibactrum halimedae TaxID=1444977 RepID=UPI001E60E67C|nr:hypothetical protein [Marinibactrum halimedae]MCD9460220.1 hypothetical protein [Marinibactrum halimedae]
MIIIEVSVRHWRIFSSGKGYGVWRDACPLRGFLAAKRGSDDGANKNAAADLQAA